MTPRLLAVTHEASRTGAPAVLAAYLERLTATGSAHVHTVVLRDGPLRARYAAAGEVTVLDRTGAQSLLAFGQQGLQHLGSRRASRALAAARLRPQLRRLDAVDVIHLNSLTSVEVLPHLPPARLVVAHVHELSVAMRLARPALRELLATGPDRWVAVSAAVATALVEEVGVPADRIAVHHPFVDVAALRAQVGGPRRAGALRRQLGIGADRAIVVGSGMVEWRKGPDLFVQLAAEVERRRPGATAFLWVGGDRVGLEWERLRSDLEQAAPPNVHLVPATPEPAALYSLADVFALTSREDPYPLVAIEHAALGTPIVTYRNGGAPELLAAAGPAAALGVADHLDVGGLAAAVLRYLDDPDLADAAGSELRRHVERRHDVAASADALWAWTEQELSGR